MKHIAQVFLATLFAVATPVTAATLEIVDVNISDPGDFSSASSYAAGQYSLVASGDYIFDSFNDRRSDVLFFYTGAQAADTSLWTPLGFDRIVRVNSTSNQVPIIWQGAANLQNKYTASFIHDGGNINFKLNDGFFSDNRSNGSFTITIQDSVSSVPLAHSIVFLGVALSGLGGFAQRRKKG